MDIMTTKELSEYLRISVSTIRRMIAKNEIPYFRLSNKIYFNTSVVNEWIKNQDTNTIRKGDLLWDQICM